MADAADRVLDLPQVTDSERPAGLAGRFPQGVTAMPYASNDNLPPSVRDHLPPHAQDIYRAAFNHAWAQYAPQGREDIAHRIAWAAVKRRYRKVGAEWVPIEMS